MSGSSGGGGSDEWRTPGSGAGGQDKCAISEITVLNSPDATVVATISLGQELDVALLSGPRKRLVAKVKDDIAGSITSPRLVDFIECIENGYEYVAEIKAISGGRIEIEIRPK